MFARDTYLYLNFSLLGVIHVVCAMAVGKPAFYLGFAIWQLRSLWLYADVGAVLVSEATICFVSIV
jgi:hypothetical protein